MWSEGFYKFVVEQQHTNSEQHDFSEAWANERSTPKKRSLPFMSLQGRAVQLMCCWSKHIQIKHGFSSGTQLCMY